MPDSNSTVGGQAITPEFIEATDAAKRAINAHISRLAREIHLMRTGNAVNDGYGLHAFRLTKWDGTQYAGIEDDRPDFKIGEPIVVTELYHARWACEINVTFPQSYLTEDWRPIEHARIDAEKERLRTLAERDKIVRQQNTEAAERREFERLKAKFGASS